MYFRSLQIFRGFAALAVVLYHAHCYLETLGGEPNTAFHVFGVPFSRGAWFFFALSGFLMAQQVTTGSGRFLARRLVRIYPSYWLAVAGVLFLKVAIFGGVSQPGLLGGMTLLPISGGNPGERYALGIEWTLIFEVFFYGVCSVFANRWLKGSFGYFLAGWVAVIIASGASAEMIPTFRQIPLSPYNLLFATGGLMFFAWRGLVEHPRVLLAVGVLGLAAFVPCWSLVGLPLIGSAGIGFAGVIALGLAWDHGREKPASGPGFLERFGDRSYGLYLVHVPVITIIVCQAHLISGWKTTTALGCLATAAALGAGWFFGSLDLLIHQRCKRLVSAPRPTPTPNSTGAHPSLKGPHHMHADRPGAEQPALRG